MRLAGSTAAGEGRMQIQAGGIWGAVSASLFQSFNNTYLEWVVTTVCKEVGGYTRGRAVYGNFFYAPGSLPQWTSLQCTGMESSLADCTWAGMVASQSVDVNIACSSKPSGGYA